MKYSAKLIASLTTAIALSGTPFAWSQSATPVPAAGSTTDAAPAPAAAVAPAPAAATAPAQAGPVKVSHYEKVKGKEVYTGPAEIVVLDPTPMLDEEGRQRLDPDGKPMFNAPVKQQRDKKGHPLFDDKDKPVFQTATDLGYDEKGSKIHVQKEKAAKLTPVSISRGTFTVDGVVGKAALNYDIADLKYIYLYVPGIGTTVISNEPFPGAKEQKGAFNDKTLTVTVEDHTLQLASDKRLLAAKVPGPAYVLLDRDFQLPARAPVVGYGDTRKAPYMWPGAKPNAQLAGVADAPPPPNLLRPTLALSPCPKGQMRMPGPPVLPGQNAPVQPCVSMAQGAAAEKSLSMAAARKSGDQGAKPAATPASASPVAPAPPVPAPPQTN